jgi:hypothetical protein
MVAKIHKNEMIVPAAGADVLRRGGVGGAYQIGSFDGARSAQQSGPVPISVQYHGDARPKVESAEMVNGKLLLIMREVAREEVSKGTPKIMKAHGIGRPQTAR